MQESELEQETGTIDKECDRAENVLEEAAQEVIGKWKIIRNQEWFDEDYAKAIEERHKARRKVIQK